MDTLVVDPFWTVFPDFFGTDMPELFKHTSPDAWLRFERAEIDEATWFAEAFRDRRRFDGDALKAAVCEAYRLIAPKTLARQLDDDR